MFRKRIYLDHAAATPLDREAFCAMKPFLREEFGNPSALYREGVFAEKAIRTARGAVARVLSAHPDEIIFTGSGTESDNMAIFGVVRAYREAYRKKPHVVASAIEHPAVLIPLQDLEKRGEIEATYVPVRENGIVDPAEVKRAIRENTALVSVMYANNEIGTVQPVKEIAKIVRRYRKAAGGAYPLLHTDACQAVNYLEMSVEFLGVDLLTVNGLKVYGPKGVGALYKRRGVRIAPLLYGGEQEMGLRAGTEHVAGIAGFAKAMEIAAAKREKESRRLRELRDDVIAGLLKRIPDSIINGDLTERLPNNIHISFPRVESERLVIELDARGIAASAKSACKSRDMEPSYVLMALGRARLGGEGALRLTMGRGTREKDMEYVLDVLPAVVRKIQEPPKREK